MGWRRRSQKQFETAILVLRHANSIVYVITQNDATPPPGPAGERRSKLLAPNSVRGQSDVDIDIQARRNEADIQQFEKYVRTGRTQLLKKQAGQCSVYNHGALVKKAPMQGFLLGIAGEPRGGRPGMIIAKKFSYLAHYVAACRTVRAPAADSGRHSGRRDGRGGRKWKRGCRFYSYSRKDCPSRRTPRFPGPISPTCQFSTAFCLVQKAEHAQLDDDR